MEVGSGIELLIDIGCGYGTFLFPESRIVRQAVGIDIDPGMIEYCRKMIEKDKYQNIELIAGDISSPELSGQLASFIGRADYVTLFNILHCEEPVKLLNTVYRLLKPGGKAGAIHWKHMQTPRGPALEIRPKPEQIAVWAKEAGFILRSELDLPPYHYGLIFTKP